ncbi:MAG: tyrosine-type recombinase/integrase [Planctomycetota bacterium]
MPREPKPYYRKAQKRWVCTINGTRVTLGKTKAEAMVKFHQLMLKPHLVSSEISTIYQLSQTYLDWVEQHRKPGTYANHRRYLKSFVESIGKSMKIGSLRKHHILSWAETKGTTTSQNDAISVVLRMFNWAVEQEYLSDRPISRIKKPKRKRREIVYTPEQWEKIKAEAKGSLLPLLNFLWLTGCRPKEARIPESRHVHDDVIIFPPDESKGETDSRVIFLTPAAHEVLKPFLTNAGPLFRNSRGNPWTKDAIKCSLTRISNKVGFRVIAYGIRHSYATNALIRSVDPVSLSHLMGHKDTRMINNYAHLNQNQEFLKQQAIAASKPLNATAVGR